MTRGYEDALRIGAKRHDIVGIHVVDPNEESLPPVGLFRAVDAETGERIWVDTNNPSVRHTYSNWYKDNFNYFKNVFTRTGVDSMSIKTTESYVNILMKFFKKRIK